METCNNRFEYRAPRPAGGETDWMRLTSPMPSPSIDFWFLRNWDKSLLAYAPTLPSKGAAPSERALSEVTSLDEERSRRLVDSLLRRRTARRFDKVVMPKAKWKTLLSTVFATLDSLPARQRLPLSLLRTSIILYSVEGLEPGLYQLDNETCEFHLKREGDFRAKVSTLIQGLQAPMSASFTLLIEADLAAGTDLQVMHGSLRETYMWSGWLAQAWIAAAACVSLSSLPTPAISDDGVADLLGYDSPMSACLYSVTIGCRSSDGLKAVTT